MKDERVEGSQPGALYLYVKPCNYELILYVTRESKKISIKMNSKNKEDVRKKRNETIFSLVE